MNVLHIQSSDNVNYKAKFINDKNGYLVELWNNSCSNSVLKREIDIFAKKNLEDVIEIIEFKNNTYIMKNLKDGAIYSHQIRKGRKYNVLFDIIEMLNNQLSIFNKLLGEDVVTPTIK